MAERGVVSVREHGAYRPPSCDPFAGMRNVANRWILEPCSCIAAHDVATGEDDRFTKRASPRPRVGEIECRQHATRARLHVCAEDRKPKRSLDELHRRRMAWIDLNRVGDAIP